MSCKNQIWASYDQSLEKTPRTSIRLRQLTCCTVLDGFIFLDKVKYYTETEKEKREKSEWEIQISDSDKQNDQKETFKTVLQELRELNNSFVYPEIIKRVNQKLNLTSTVDSGCAVDYFREHKVLKYTQRLEEITRYLYLHEVSRSFNTDTYKVRFFKQK